MAFPTPDAAWNYGEASGAVVDQTGNGRGFALTGTTARTAAGGGYTYGGAQPNTKGLTQASNEVQAGPSPAFLNVAAWSIATWAKAAPADPSWFLELFNNTLGGGTGVAGWLMLSSSLRGRIKNSSNTAFEQTVTPDGTNYHYFAITHDGTNLKVYRDTAGTLALIGTVAAAFTRATADVFRVFDNSGSGCILSETRMWTTALTLAELQEASSTPVVAATVSVTPASVAQVQAVSAVALSQKSILGTPSAVAQVQAVSTPALAQKSVLAVSDVVQVQAVAAVSVAQRAQLSVGAVTQAQALDAPVLAAGGVLGPVAVTQVQSMGAVVLAQRSQLVVGGVSQLQRPAAVVLAGPVQEYDAPTHWSLTTAPGATARTRSTAFTATPRQAGYTATTRSDT